MNKRKLYILENKIRREINNPIRKRLQTDSDLYIPDEDWDVLVVFDSCRADIFEETYPEYFGGEYSVRESKASMTKEWLHKNFGTFHSDIVYVTENPMVSIEKPTAFHHLYEPWKTGFSEQIGQYNSVHTSMTAVDAMEKYPEKRIIIHYMKPHVPFVNTDLRFTTWNAVDFDVNESTEYAHIWHALAENEVGLEETVEAYKNNLRYGFRSFKRIMQHAKQHGKVVLTSDHGNLYEYRYSWPIPVRITGHPSHCKHPELIEVPWLELQ